MYQDPTTYCDKPNKPQKHPHFEHRTKKLDMKNNEFTSKKFQRVRHVSNERKLLKSMKRIGKCLNDSTPADIQTQGLQKVCFIMINFYEHEKHNPKIGPLNDAYLFGANQHRQGFKVFYLYNCERNQYVQFFNLFLKFTLKCLTVFYSGPMTDGSNGIEFKESDLSSNESNQLINENYNHRCKVVFITDSTSSGSVFNDGQLPENVISLSAGKSTDPDSKEGRRSHGISTYYLCKIFNDCPNITPQFLEKRMNDSIRRFNASFIVETDQETMNKPIFE